jgi:hypothetical protein
LIAPREIHAEDFIAHLLVNLSRQTFPDAVGIAGLFIEFEFGSHAEICSQDMLSYHVFLRVVAPRDHFAFAAPYKGARCKTAKALSLAVQLQTAKVTAKGQI